MDMRPVVVFAMFVFIVLAVWLAG
jgi:hypothetical protein